MPSEDFLKKLEKDFEDISEATEGATAYFLDVSKALVSEDEEVDEDELDFDYYSVDLAAFDYDGWSWAAVSAKDFKLDDWTDKELELSQFGIVDRDGNNVGDTWSLVGYDKESELLWFHDDREGTIEEIKQQMQE